MANEDQEEFEPTEVELLILRNQRAILRALVMNGRFEERSLIGQGQETYDFLKRHNALGEKKK